MNNDGLLNPFDLVAIVEKRGGYTEEEIAEAMAPTAAETRRAERAAAVEANPCKRCGGSGVLDHYWHVRGGVCFRCGGNGVDPR